jgi:hypothetical protein
MPKPRCGASEQHSRHFRLLTPCVSVTHTSTSMSSISQNQRAAMKARFLSRC